MPLEIKRVPPSPAFSVEYQGERIWIYHTYLDEIESMRLDHVYTADEEEGVRNGHRRHEGIKGEYGFTVDEHRNDYFFDTSDLYKMMSSLPEFYHPTKKFGFEWPDKFIVQIAIEYGLIGFDEDFRFVDATMIEFPIKSCTGGLIVPVEVKAVSNG
jgi:hypothetical protein|tara:strand:+ start:512 stop:979 length:468 start_codon:yes stop_codon:yes gene_type:complete